MPSSGRVGHNGADRTEVLGGGDPKRQPRLGRYRLERRIGQGGMAEVFLARAEGPGGFEKQVVIKRIRPQLVKNERFVEMFLREGRLLAGLDHPNIVRVFELDEAEGEYFLALEYLDGLSLRELMERYWFAGRTVPLEPVLRVFSEAALGLAHAHGLKEPGGASANLVHRDVSPDNLFVTSTSITKVLDFGIAKREGLDVLTQTGELKGKIQFMSPEALRGDTLDARTDLWSFGITMYWACAGRRPFDGVTDVHTIKGILEDPPPPLRQFNSKLPVAVEDIVASCLEKDRSKRVKSAAQLHDTLSALLLDLPRGAPTPAELVAAARALPSVEHEITPRTAAVAPTVQWPDRTMPVAVGSSGGSSSMIGARGKNALPLPEGTALESAKGTEAATKIGRKFQSSVPPTDKVRPKVEAAEASDGSGEFEGATDLVPAAALHTTDEHRRVMVSTEHSDEALGTTGPLRLEGDGAVQQGFQPPSDPVIDVEREPRSGPRAAAPAVSPSAPTMPHVDLAGVAAGAHDIHDQHTQAMVALPQWPEAAEVEIPAARPARVAPVLAGIVTALAIVVGALHLSGMLNRVIDGLLGRAYAGLDAGTDLPVDAAHEVIAAPVDAGAVVVDGGGAALIDAGAAPVVVDAGSAAPAGRTLTLIGPEHIEWLGPTAEPLGLARVTVQLASDAKVVFAKDARRGCTTRITLAPAQHTVDYARLPKGKITVRTRPPAEVFLGGERLGRTPLPPRELVAGHCELRLVARKKSKKVPVEVRAGKTTTLTQDLR